MYCVLGSGADLDTCENIECVMNNCDGVEEAAESSPMLCPTCMRKLHLRGLVDDVPACRARVEAVLAEEGLLLRNADLGQRL